MLGIPVLVFDMGGAWVGGHAPDMSPGGSVLSACAAHRDTRFPRESFAFSVSTDELEQERAPLHILGERGLVPFTGPPRSLRFRDVYANRTALARPLPGGRCVTAEGAARYGKSSRKGRQSS